MHNFVGQSPAIIIEHYNRTVRYLNILYTVPYIQVRYTTVYVQNVVQHTPPFVPRLESALVHSRIVYTNIRSVDARFSSTAYVRTLLVQTPAVAYSAFFFLCHVLCSTYSHARGVVSDETKMSSENQPDDFRACMA